MLYLLLPLLLCYPVALQYDFYALSFIMSIIKCNVIMKKEVFFYLKKELSRFMKHKFSFMIFNIMLFGRQNLLIDSDSRLVAKNKQNLQYVPFKYIDKSCSVFIVFVIFRLSYQIPRRQQYITIWRHCSPFLHNDKQQRHNVPSKHKEAMMTKTNQLKFF